MSFHLPPVPFSELVAQRNKDIDARGIRVKPRSQAVSVCGLVALLLHPDAELQVVGTGTKIVDRRYRGDAHGYPFPPSTPTMCPCCCANSSTTEESAPRSSTPW